MESSAQGRALFGAFGLLVLGLALWVVRRTPWLTWVAVLLAMPVIVLAVIAQFAPRPGLTVVIAALEAALYFYAAGSLISYMLQDWVATTDELFAAGATFTLLGATRGRVLSAILGETVATSALGIMIGAVAALFATRLAAPFLFGVAPTDPVTLFGVAAVLATTTLVAGYVPGPPRRIH